MTQEKHHEEKTITYYVDSEPRKTDERQLTPNEILKEAGYDSQKYYLVEIEGQKQISFKDKGNEEIHMHENMKFITVLIQGGVPLSLPHGKK